MLGKPLRILLRCCIGRPNRLRCKQYKYILPFMKRGMAVFPLRSRQDKPTNLGERRQPINLARHILKDALEANA